MSYNGLPIRQLMGARKYIRFSYHGEGDVPDGGWNFKGKVDVSLVPDIESNEMEDGTLRVEHNGFRIGISVSIYNIEGENEQDIVSLNSRLTALNNNIGSLYIYPYYDPDYTGLSQNHYKILETGTRIPAYIHPLLPTAQVFSYEFTGVDLVNGEYSPIVVKNKISGLTAVKPELSWKVFM